MSNDDKPLVLVIWDDAEDPEDGKTWMDDADVEAFSTQSCTVTSVGYLLSQTEKYTTLAGDWIEGLGHYGRVTKIPAKMVQATHILTKS